MTIKRMSLEVSSRAAGTAAGAALSIADTMGAATEGPAARAAVVRPNVLRKSLRVELMFDFLMKDRRWTLRHDMSVNGCLL